MISLINSDYNHPINLGNPSEFTMLELAELIKEKTNSSAEIIFKDLPIDDPKRRCPDIGKANKILNWNPEISLNEGLNDTIVWFKSQIFS